MKIKFRRSKNIFVAEYGNKYFLVNIEKKTLLPAKPEDSPNMFLKFGYFTEVDDNEVSEEVKQRVKEVIESN